MTRDSNRRLRVGAFVDSIAPLAVVRLQMGLARALGADDLWFGDHVGHAIPKSLWVSQDNPMARFVPDPDAWFDPTVLIARYARRWGPRMGTSVTDPYRRSAADLARAWLSLHHTTGGNVVLGIGAGEVMNLRPIGVPMTKPIARLEDTLSAIRAVWSSEMNGVTHSGPFHRWEGATFPPPYRGSTPPIWVAAEGPKACEVAGTYGDGWMTFSAQRKAWETAALRVAASADAAGKDPERMDRSVAVMSVLVSNPAYLEQACMAPLVQTIALLVFPARAWSAAGLSHPLGGQYAGVSELERSIFEGDQLIELRKQVTPDLFGSLMPCGSADEVAASIAELVDHGVSHVVVANLALMAGAGPTGLAMVKDSLSQQRRLIRILKKMQPGRLGS